jgi:hypothetical protein
MITSFYQFLFVPLFSMAPSHLISKAALALAAMVYVDSKYYISKDISEIMTGLKMRKVVLKK